jgi:RNA polymerase sigma factor (TIGR02999 family)
VNMSHDPAPRAELDQVFSAAYEELRRLAAAVRRHDPSATLTPTALVNEAWLKLSATPAAADTSPLHFRRIAARAMRQVLVEAARRRTADKRGGGRAMVTLDESLDGGGVDTLDVVILDEALGRLATLSPRQAMLVEQRFFGGLEMDDVARSLGISEATAYREWRAARAWLGRELGQDRQGKP